MKITTLRRASCPVGHKCEGIHALDTDQESYYVITKQVTDERVLAAFAAHIGPGEQLGTLTRTLLPEL